MYIWYDKNNKGRNLYGSFRKSFNIDGGVKSANINVFADTVYKLFVNGIFVESGPVRFNPKFPLYDSHDIKEYLVEGKNAITIIVNSFGMKTYKAIPNDAGLTCFGEIELESGERIPLETNTSWKAKKTGGCDLYAQKLSFALNPTEIYNQASEDNGFSDLGDLNWNDAVIVENVWGELKPRNIGYFSKENLDIKKVVGVFPLDKKETLYSFRIPLPVFFEDNNPFSSFIAFSTYVYSPVEQDVTVGTFWGEHFLNGEFISAKTTPIDKCMRINERWKLKKGFNYFFGKVGAYFDALDTYFAFPDGKGISLSADKTSDAIFKHSRVVTKEEYDRFLKDKELPYDEKDNLEEIGGWQLVYDKDKSNSAAREISWQDYNGEFERVENIEGYTFKNYDNGFSILIDLEYTKTFMPTIELTGVKGAVVDIGYSEFLTNGGRTITFQHHYMMADRLLCTKDKIKWQSMNLRSGRYIQIVVRNNQGPVTINEFKLKSMKYDLEVTGSFECSDVLLNKIWEAGKTTLLTSLQDVYVDCPTRECGLYARDAIIQFYVDNVISNNIKTMNRALELYGQSNEKHGKFRAVYPCYENYSISDFCLDLVDGYWYYYEVTKDIERIKTDYEAIKTNLLWFHNLSDEREDLLLDADWYARASGKHYYKGFHGDNIPIKGYIDKSGVHCTFSCAYLSAMKSAEKMANLMEDYKYVKMLQEKIKTLTASIQKFWDKDKNCFSDNLNFKSHSIQTNLTAVNCGACTPEQIEIIKEYAKSELKSLFVSGYGPEEGYLTSPSYSFYIFRALYTLDLVDLAEDLMRQGWGWMLSTGLKTTAEYFDVTTEGTSLCHAWSAAPTYYLSRYILGVCPVGEDEVLIDIKASSKISSAEGIYPYKTGQIKVKWHIEGEKRVFDILEAPNGVKIIHG